MAKKVTLDDDDFEEELEAEEEVEEASEDSADAPEEEPALRGGNTGLTIGLCILNIVAALAFTYLLVRDFHKRQEWSYAVFMNEFRIIGLPLLEENEAVTASQVTMPRQQLDADQIRSVFSMRGGKGGGQFWVVDEDLPHRIKAKNLNQAILKDYFGSDYVGSSGGEVDTLEKEIGRLKTKVPEDIAQAAKDIVAALKGKDDAAKHQLAKNILLPLAYNTFQVEALDKKIKDAKGPQLDALIDDGVQRRLLVGILAPCEIFRPGDVNKFFVETVADLDKVKIDDLRMLLQKRFDVSIAPKFDGVVQQGPDWDGVDRLSLEKRQTIGFLLLAIANAYRPDPAQLNQWVPLYPEAPAPAGTPNLLRAQSVLGLYEFAAAAQNLPLAWQKLQERLIRAIYVDRQGFDIVYKDKEGKERPARNQAFIDKYEAEIERIKGLMMDIKKAQDRLEDLRGQNRTVKKIYQDRNEHLQEQTKKLLEARAKTAKMVAELRKLEHELYQAQAVLRDAAENNLRLEAAIRTEEAKAKGLKGATP